MENKSTIAVSGRFSFVWVRRGASLGAAVVGIFRWLSAWRGEKHRAEALDDFRRLRQALRDYDRNSDDIYPPTIIGLVTRKHAAWLSRVEDDMEDRLRAAEFIVATLETYRYAEAGRIIDERLNYPFRVRIAGRLKIPGLPTTHLADPPPPDDAAGRSAGEVSRSYRLTT